MIILLILAVIGYWTTPLILTIIGLTRLKSRPENAKMLLIIAAVMLVIGVGVCGAILY